MTTPEADEQANGAPREAPGQQPPPSAVSSPLPEGFQPSAESDPSPFVHGYDASAPVAETVALPTLETPRPNTATAVAPPPPITIPEVTYVPMSVSVGDGFKFGCGFFLAMVVALLVGFVLLAALFVLTGLFGLNVPLGP